MQAPEEAVPPEAGAKRGLKVVSAIAVSAATIGLLFAFGDARSYVAYLAEADYWKLWPLLLISPLAQILRSYRLALLLSPSPPLFDRHLYQMSSLYMLISGVLPFRTGEFALPVLLKVGRNVRFSAGAGFVLLMRVFDLAMVVTVCGIVAAIALPQPLWKVVGLAASLAAVAGLGVLPKSGGRVRRWIASLDVRRGRTWRIIDGLVEGAAVLQTWRRWGLVWIATLMVWIGVFSSFYISSAAITPLPITTVVLAGGSASLAFAQPVNGVAGLGVVQAAWAWTASSLGASWDVAVATGVLIHLAQLAASAFNASLAQIAVRWPRAKSGSTMDTE